MKTTSSPHNKACLTWSGEAADRDQATLKLTWRDWLLPPSLTVSTALAVPAGVPSRTVQFQAQTPSSPAFSAPGASPAPPLYWTLSSQLAPGLTRARRVALPPALTTGVRLAISAVSSAGAGAGIGAGLAAPADGLSP